MGTAVSDIGATKSPMRGNTIKSVRTSAAREVEVEVRPVVFADARLQLVSSDEVFPAERSELACRIVNVTVALVAFAAGLRFAVTRAPVPAARRVVARTASACARGVPLLVSSLVTSHISLSAVN